MISQHSRDVSSARAAAAVARGGSRRVPASLALDLWLSRATAHDDMALVVTHQTHELWFNQLLCELTVLVADLDGDRLPAASRTLERATHIAAVLAEQMRGLEAFPLAQRGDLDALLGCGGGPPRDPLRRLDLLAGTGAVAIGRWVARERRPERPRSASVREAFVRTVVRGPSGDAELQALSSCAGTSAGSELGSWLAAWLERPALAAQRELSEGLRRLDERLIAWVWQRRQLRRQQGGSARERSLVPRRFFPELWA